MGREKMTTINLHQSEQTEKSKFSSKSGLFFTVGIFACTVLFLAGLKISVNMLQKQNEDLKTQIADENKKLTGLNSIKQVADMQVRLKAIKDNLKIENGQVSRIQMSQILDYVGNNINSSGIFLASYKYTEDNKIELSLNANSFSDAAKQILNFKNSEYFSNVVLSKISRGEKYIEFDVNMNIK